MNCEKALGDLAAEHESQLFFTHGSMSSQSGHDVDVALIAVKFPDDLGDPASLRVQTGVVGRKQQETFDLLAAFLDGGDHQLSEFGI